MAAPDRPNARPGPRTGAGLAARARIVGGALVAGLVVGALAVGLLLADGRAAKPATDLAFPLFALVFGFGLVGWSGSAMAGRSIETMQRYMETGSNWTEADSRRAMARIGGFGFGGMLGVVLVGIALGV